MDLARTAYVITPDELRGMLSSDIPLAVNRTKTMKTINSWTGVFMILGFVTFFAALVYIGKRLDKKGRDKENKGN
jgi:hypothetical protein